MNAATERIVVQTTPQEKQAIVKKAKQLNMSASELMRRGANEYAPMDRDLVALAEAAKASAQRSIAMIDETTRLVAESNARIAAMEAKAKAERERKAAPTRRRRTP
ncbi:MAG: hypothetical protein KGJ97_08585 [Xanthomonadaceae bacterium]|jgi:hypothetical protein|nr:hypothetical protein [Xanthomonadaceae bacterium]